MTRGLSSVMGDTKRADIADLRGRAFDVKMITNAPKTRTSTSTPKLGNDNTLSYFPMTSSPDNK